MVLGLDMTQLRQCIGKCALITSRYFVTQFLIRAVLYYIFLQSERLDSAVREISPSEAWRYSRPMTPSYISSRALWTVVYAVPPATLLPRLLQTGDWLELRQAALASSLSLLAAGLTTNVLKAAVGRPRPDFLSRCHGAVRPPPLGRPCSGEPSVVAEGRRSFPSGHSALCSCLAVFASLFWAARARRPLSATSRALLALAPAAAALVAVSRVADCHHHWEDVTVGYALGALAALAGYRCYFPAVLGPAAAVPLPPPDQGTLERL
ncbi:phospholipid phosphatase 5-like [Amphibalanus amphitrite]|uniref:phospholipid phosphatase 5-like n=1 Tax=Amphibalanus amphitrite TaxID=1232801 RepID=UPI001C902877|nr:phospholipid phosphatase 5-like [Amphibalanus amphitrite]